VEDPPDPDEVPAVGTVEAVEDPPDPDELPAVGTVEAVEDPPDSDELPVAVAAPSAKVGAPASLRRFIVAKNLVCTAFLLFWCSVFENEC